MTGASTVLNYPVLFGLSLLLLAIATLPFLHELLVKRSSPDPFAPIFWITPAIFLVYGGALIRRLVREDFGLAHREGYQVTWAVQPVMAEVMIMANVSLALLITGYYVGKARGLPDQLIAVLPRTSVEEFSMRRSSVAIVACLVLGYVGYALLVPQLGTDVRSELAKGTNTYPFAAVNLLNVANVLIFANIGIRIREAGGLGAVRSNLSNRTLYWFAGMLLVAGLNLFILMTLGGRERAFISLIVGVFLFHYLVQRLAFWLGMLFYGVVQIVPAWAASVVGTILRMEFDRLPAALSNVQLFLDTEMTPFNNVVLVYGELSNELELQYGETFLSPIFTLSPWNPFTESDIVFTSVFAPDMVGRFGYPMTMLGELYVNFHYPGVIIGMAIIGTLVGMVYASFIQENGSNIALVVLFAAIANDYLLFGNFSNSSTMVGARLVPLLLILYYVANTES